MRFEQSIFDSCGIERNILFVCEFLASRYNWKIFKRLQEEKQFLQIELYDLEQLEPKF